MRIKKEVRKIVASVLAFLMVVSLIPVNSLMTKANAASKLLLKVERQSKTELGKDGLGMYLVAVQIRQKHLLQIQEMEELH